MGKVHTNEQRTKTKRHPLVQGATRVASSVAKSPEVRSSIHKMVSAILQAFDKAVKEALKVQ